jgi:hypothetical protein
VSGGDQIRINFRKADDVIIAGETERPPLALQEGQQTCTTTVLNLLINQNQLTRNRRCEAR